MKNLFFLIFTLTSVISFSQSEEIDTLKIEDKSRLISLGQKLEFPIWHL